MPSQILRGLPSLTVVDVWQACTVKKGYKGRLSEKKGFLARTAKGGGLAFASNAAAGRWTLFAQPDARFTNGPVRRGLELNGDEDYQDLLSNRLALTKYDGAFRVPLRDCEWWLPKQTTEAFKLYGEDVVPLLVIEHEAFVLVPSLNDRDLADLVYQLDRDVSRAQTEADDRSLDQALERLAELDAARE
ncbi:hypothetical protein [Bradyrhizobium sp. 33ap4]|uniref:hypothetical protein n=1 Tax=Bradyrhizobium sp. 33ap4 TaxID=3061630 RepID=UPI00292E761B|nr:hypothetical protein [Bradyrhizobium sp. 33ap4]